MEGLMPLNVWSGSICLNISKILERRVSRRCSDMGVCDAR
jgi:hypothetical protein